MKSSTPAKMYVSLLFTVFLLYCGESASPSVSFSHSYYVFFSRPCVKAALHFHSGNTGIYLLPCRPERIIIGSLQSPVYLRLRLRLLLMPAHARRVGQYLVAVPVIHMDGGTRPLGLELSLIRLPEQEAQPPLVIRLDRYLLKINRETASLSIPPPASGLKFKSRPHCLRRIGYRSDCSWTGSPTKSPFFLFGGDEFVM